jgi:diketogulonate reductase-like aldo/keto reductase
MAEKYHVSVPQLASRFVLQLGLLPIPKSVHEERIQQNAKLDFEINSNDMATLLELDGL